MKRKTARGQSSCPSRPGQLEEPPLAEAIFFAKGWTGPGLKGKAPFFKGLGQLIFFTASDERQCGQTTSVLSDLQIFSNDFPH